MGSRAPQLLMAAAVAGALASAVGCARPAPPASGNAPRGVAAPAPAWLAVGVHAMGDGDFARAEAAFHAALRFDARCAAAWRGLSWVAAAAGDEGAAAAACATAAMLAADPHFCARAAPPAL